MATEQPIITHYDGECDTFTQIAYECKFTVESDSCVGGDWERNTGGAHDRKRISFDGYASSEVYAALIGAINKVVEK